MKSVTRQTDRIGLKEQRYTGGRDFRGAEKGYSDLVEGKGENGEKGG